MTEDQQERLRALETTVSAIRVRQAEISLQIDNTVAQIAAVKADTAAIVEALKGASVLGRISKWFAAVIGAFFAGKGLKLW